ncbi:hypothetical protein ABK040_012603 [Willaertia magna]
MKYCASNKSSYNSSYTVGQEEEYHKGGMKLYTTAIHKKRFHSTILIESSCSSNSAIVNYDPTNIKVIDKENIELASKLVQLFIPIIEINYNEKCLALQTSEKDIIYKEIIKTSEFKEKIRDNTSPLQFYHFSKNDNNFLQRNIIGIIYKSINGVVTCYFTALEK